MEITQTLILKTTIISGVSLAFFGRKATGFQRQANLFEWNCLRKMFL